MFRRLFRPTRWRLMPRWWIPWTRGRAVLEQIRKMGEWEDTPVLFLSDNGASAEIMVRGRARPEAPWASAFTYLCLGPGRSTVSNTSFRMHKTWVHEAGPARLWSLIGRRGSGKGRILNRVGHVIDLIPTVLELAGLPSRKESRTGLSGNEPESRLQGQGASQTRDLWWAHDGHRAYRSGD